MLNTRSNLTHLVLHRNQFFRYYYQNKSSESKVKFREANNSCERDLEAAKLAYANKTKESITSQRFDLWDFWWIANSVLKSAIPLLFNSPELLSSASDKENCLLKTFLRTLILKIQVSPALPSRTNLKLHIFVTTKMVKKIILNLNLSIASGPNPIPVVVLNNYEPKLSHILAEL